MNRLEKIQLTLEMWKWRFKSWLRKFFPRDTGLLESAAELTVDNAKVIGTSIYFDLWEGAPEYAPYVDKIVGVNWTNQNTQQIEGAIYMNGTIEGLALFEKVWMDVM